MKENNYGPTHGEIRKQLIDEHGNVCEITGLEGEVEAHHVVNRWMSGGGKELLDVKENYQLLATEFHRQLHDVCWASDTNMIVQRAHVRKKIAKNPEDTKSIERMKDLDKTLMPEYIHNLINKLPHEFREALIESTLIANFATIRDLTIEILLLRKQLEAVQNEDKGTQKKEGNILPFKKRK